MSSPPHLRVAVLTSIRFHMFDLARQLRLIGHEVSLLTGYPKWRLDADLREIAITHPYLVTPLVGLYLYRIPVPVCLRRQWNRLARRELSSWARKYLSGVRILDALSSWGLEAGEFIQESGGIHVCNRGSSHILHQKKMLDEEYPKWGVAAPEAFGAWNVDRELAEYEHANAIVIPSSFAKQTFLSQGVRSENVFVCPYGVELSLFNPRPKEDNRFRVIFVGGYSIRKGIGYLFEALRPLVQQGHVELWLVGGPSLEAEGILAKNSDIFIDKGFHPRNKLSWFYSQADVLVLPSVEEGLALVQAQAMACGVPVIATHNTGAEDLFTDGKEGFIVPLRDPDAIREKIEWMLENPRDRRVMGAAALRQVENLGGWKTYAEKCNSMYLELISQTT